MKLHKADTPLDRYWSVAVHQLAELQRVVEE
jgi:hypothetical protein